MHWLAEFRVYTVTARAPNAVPLSSPCGDCILALKVPKNSTTDYWTSLRRSCTDHVSMRNGAYVVWGYNRMSTALCWIVRHRARASRTPHSRWANRSMMARCPSSGSPMADHRLTNTWTFKCLSQAPGPTQTPTPYPTPTLTPTATATSTPAPTPTPAPSPNATMTSAPTPTSSPTQRRSQVRSLVAKRKPNSGSGALKSASLTGTADILRRRLRSADCSASAGMCAGYVLLRRSAMGAMREGLLANAV